MELWIVRRKKKKLNILTLNDTIMSWPTDPCLGSMLFFSCRLLSSFFFLVLACSLSPFAFWHERTKTSPNAANVVLWRRTNGAAGPAHLVALALGVGRRSELQRSGVDVKTAQLCGQRGRDQLVILTDKQRKKKRLLPAFIGFSPLVKQLQNKRKKLRHLRAKQQQQKMVPLEPFGVNPAFWINLGRPKRFPLPKKKWIKHAIPKSDT